MSAHGTRDMAQMPRIIRYKCPTEGCEERRFYRQDFVYITEDGDEDQHSPGDDVKCLECDEVAIDVDLVVDDDDDDDASIGNPS